MVRNHQQLKSPEENTGGEDTQTTQYQLIVLVQRTLKENE